MPSSQKFFYACPSFYSRRSTALILCLLIGISGLSRFHGRVWGGYSNRIRIGGPAVALRQTWFPSDHQSLKRLAFFKAAYALYDSEFYVKADDDIYLRPESFPCSWLKSVPTRKLTLDA